jgi:hypothetical protein
VVAWFDNGTAALALLLLPLALGMLIPLRPVQAARGPADAGAGLPPSGSSGVEPI